jgi:hypothetical protein
MIYQTTKKEIRNGYHRIVGVSYCNVQYLLNYKHAESYCAGVYGWSCDNYNVNGVCISTGYNYINNMNTSYKYDELKKYDDMACKIVCDNSIDYDQKVRGVDQLLSQFINACVNGCDNA